MNYDKDRDISKGLTDEEKITNDETYQHIQYVQKIMFGVVTQLLGRANRHDASKTMLPEVEGFAKHTKNLSKLTYGSDKYKAELEAMKPTLDHHYKHNRHHPEYHSEGIDGMNLIDVIEMICDWRAAVARHTDGDIQKSLEINKERFGISDQLMKILENTVRDLL